ncbi:cyclase family protein [Candidatus Roizmanbacteria bacterium]|nr:MAG: cyclase family protein [Candidatus Roizmanbacteria bacterium]
MQYTEIIDISVPLTTKTTVYPGNPSVIIEELKSETSASTISKLTMGSHTGTHVDAPKHVFAEGEGVGVYDLFCFVGDARVIDCTQDDVEISRKTLEQSGIQKGERILLKTANSGRLREPFFSDFIFLSPEGAAYLAEVGVRMVAIDYFSIKQKGSTDNRPHTELLSKNIPIIEGVDLQGIEPGEYFLSALPLKFDELDGAPMRAVLMR